MAVVTSITTSAVAGEQSTTVSTGSLREGDLLADRRLYLDGAGLPVEADNAQRAELLAAAGTIIPKERAEKFGMRSVEGRVVWGVEAEKAEKSAEAAQEAQETAPGAGPDSADPQPKSKAATRAKATG